MSLRQSVAKISCKAPKEEARHGHHRRCHRTRAVSFQGEYAPAPLRYSSLFIGCFKSESGFYRRQYMTTETAPQPAHVARVRELTRDDTELRALIPDESVLDALKKPGLSLQQMIHTAL